MLVLNLGVFISNGVYRNQTGLDNVNMVISNLAWGYLGDCVVYIILESLGAYTGSDIQNVLDKNVSSKRLHHN